MRAILLTVLLLALAVPAADADVLATVETPGAGGDLDIRTFNAATGTSTALPAGINSAADELHPSLSSDGGRLVFERVDHAAGTTRIITYDFSTGRSADLYDAFSSQQNQPGTPSIAADGLSVLTGLPLEHRDASTADSFRQTAIQRTSLGSFPSSPFPHATQTYPHNFGLGGRTLNPVENGGRLAFAVSIGQQGVGDIEVESNTGSAVVNEQNTFLGHPALSSSLVVFERAPIVNGVAGNADLAFRTSDPTHINAASDASLPQLVNTGADESRPAFSADDRYLGFVRRDSRDGHDRLFVFDTTTQTLLNSTGVDLGATSPLARSDGNLVLREKFVLALNTTTLIGSTFKTTVLAPTGVGIVVQRIIGRHKLLGHVAPKLRFVGRVPFGPQKKGRFVHTWDRRVNGRRLAPGRYLVTLRAVTRTGVVREFGRSFTIRIARRIQARAR